MMTNGDPEGRIFLSHPHTNNGLFFLLTIKYRILYFKLEMCPWETDALAIAKFTKKNSEFS